ncbi:unnamed protein product [Boreogadus saida]
MLKGDVGRRPATDWPESVTKSRERHGNHAGVVCVAYKDTSRPFRAADPAHVQEYCSCPCCGWFSVNHQIKKKTQMNTIGRETTPPPFTTSEELALVNNEGRPMMIYGGMSSDPTASTSKAFETLSACDSRATMEREMAFDGPSTSTSSSSRPSRGTDKIGTDTIRALYKRNLELDNDIKVLVKKKLKIEIQLLERGCNSPGGIVGSRFNPPHCCPRYIRKKKR